MELDLTFALLAIGAAALCVVVSWLTLWTIKIARVHAKYDHLPGPKRTRLACVGTNGSTRCGILYMSQQNILF